MPTLAEPGFPDMVSDTGCGFAMPAEVPKDAAAAMEAVLRKMCQTQVWKKCAAHHVRGKIPGGVEFVDYMRERESDSAVRAC